MFSITIQPRFGDTDCLGHINNVVPAVWFETGRNPIIKIFSPDLKIDENFSLIIAHTDYDFVDQLFYQYEVEIRTWISHIGNKSFTVYQEAWQEGRLGVKGSVVIVHFNVRTKESTPVPEDKKKQLEAHLLPAKP